MCLKSKKWNYPLYFDLQSAASGNLAIWGQNGFRNGKECTLDQIEYAVNGRLTRWNKNKQMK